MAAPTFVAEYEGTWNNNTTPKTVAATAAANDVFVVVGATENGNTTVSAPTGGTGITWTQQETQGATGTVSHCRIFTATGLSAQSWTLSVARSATANWWGFNGLRFSGSDGIGAAESTNNGTASGLPTINITTTAANSALVAIVANWNGGTAEPTWGAINGYTPTVANGGTVSFFGNTSNYAVSAAVWPDVGAAGVKTVSQSAPTGQRYVIAVVEVLGTASGTPATFTTNAGDATAEGGSSTLTGAALFSTTAGDAPAGGGSASFTGAALFTTVTGDASAEGGSSTFTGAAVFTTVAGDATAEGGVSTFSAGSGVTFTTLAGDAAADGGSSSLTGAALFTTNAGDAAASGGSSTFTGGSSSTFTTLTGDATAEGGTGAFTAPGTFTTLAGAATAEGGSSTFAVAVVFATLTGDASAAGGSSTFTGAAVFATAAGNASGSGGVSLFIAGAIPAVLESIGTHREHGHLGTHHRHGSLGATRSGSHLGTHQESE